MKNIAYQTARLAEHFSRHRVAWQQFYDSEKLVIDRLDLGSRHEVLDIGCGCGGLGLALKERFGVVRYTGIEINAKAAATAMTLNRAAAVICGDILSISQAELRGRNFDVVFSLSCVDWNVQYTDMLEASWRHVRPGGNLISTFRLTTGVGCSDLEQSHQFINFDGAHEGERAAYVVLNAKELLDQLARFNPEMIEAYGYWGRPSETAVTPYDTLCFAAFSIKKRVEGNEREIDYKLNLPAAILESIGLQAE